MSRLLQFCYGHSNKLIVHDIHLMIMLNVASNFMVSLVDWRDILSLLLLGFGLSQYGVPLWIGYAP